MSHDTHSGHPKENKTIISFRNSFWLMVILGGLFIAALNFVQSESAPDKNEAKEGTRTENTYEMHEAKKPEENAGPAKQQEGPAKEDSARKAK